MYKSIIMKKIFFPLLFVFTLSFSSCSEDPCYVGDWTMTNPMWILSTTVTVNNDNTGTMIVVDPSCPSSGNQTRVYNFSWTYIDNVFAFAFSTQGQKCGVAHTFTGNDVITGIAGTLTCGNDAMTLDTPSWDYNFTRN